MLVKADDVRAPYADTPIKLSMLSTTGQRHKTYYCVECRHPFLQRSDDTLYRINNDEEPGPVRMFDGMLITRCAKCGQKYAGTVTPTVRRFALDLHQMLQTLYVEPAVDKHERFIRCLECGNSFVTLTDRITMIVDNSLPIEFVPPTSIGLVEMRCKINRCRQRWALRL